ncbi:MAG TPA: hypothetical protein VFP34_18055 [Microlunatus sp.]|nr:hypothetical protein [Microlunatus sp.]
MDTLGGAKTAWDDFLGTAAADASLARSHRSLYELSELDRDHWRIVGMDLEWRGTSPRVVVYAVDRGDELADGGGPVAVAGFVLSDVRAQQFLQEAFAVLKVRVMAREFRDRPFRVTGVTELSVPAG